MAEYSAVYTLTMPDASTVVFNAASGDTYRNDPTQSSGLDGAPLRTPIDDASLDDGGLVHPFYKAARHVTFAGLLYVVSSGTESGFTSARNTLENNLRVAAEKIIRADGTLQWTPTGGSSRTLTVRCDLLPTFSGGFQKSYLIGFVAANPDWS